MIELSLLEQLLAFEKYGTITAASERLHLSQPALSRSMQKLEELMGAPLFERQRNKILLNANGKLTAEYAARIMEMEKDMVERVRLHDRNSRTITIGACAPVPVFDIVPILSRLYAGMTIASEINNEKELLSGLKEERYQIIVLHQAPSEDYLYVQAYRRERLYLSVPPEHPLAGKQELYLKELEGHNILLYTKIGFWYDLCCRKIPDAHFLMMDERDAFGIVAETGAFPSFTTDVMMQKEKIPENRQIIPILDEEADVTYYFICKDTKRKYYDKLCRALKLYG